MKSYAEALESYLIPAEEGFFANLYRKHHEKKVNKAKITLMCEKFNTIKTTTIMSNFVRVAKNHLVEGPEGAKIVRDAVKTMQDADTQSGISKNPDKITSFDFIIKTINGVTIAGLPDYPDSQNGLAYLIVPVRNDRGQVYDEVVLRKQVASAIINPENDICGVSANQ